MTPQDIITEMNDHGFSDTSEVRKVAALNAAIKNICYRNPWPFLQKVVTLTFDGTNPYPSNAPTDLRTVIHCLDTTTGQRVRFMRTSDIEDTYGSSLTQSGTPLYYYFEGGQLRFWQVPAASQTLRLRYIRTVPDVADSDPESAILIPRDYHEAIVFRALWRLYDLEDDPELSARFEAHYENTLAQMSDALLSQQLDEPDYIHDIDGEDYFIDYC